MLDDTWRYILGCQLREAEVRLGERCRELREYLDGHTEPDAVSASLWAAAEVQGRRVAAIREMLVASS